MSVLAPESYVELLDPVAIFGRIAPLEVDLGCGDGAFLVERARQKPGSNLLGVDRMRGRVETASRKIKRHGLVHTRVLQLESAFAVQHVLAPGSVAMFHLLFPDPWPKRRHWRRRVVTPGFLRSLAQALAPDGLLRIVTDDPEYLSAMELALQSAGRFVPTEEEGEPFPLTTFEKHFQRTGVEIYRRLLANVSPERKADAFQ